MVASVRPWKASWKVTISLRAAAVQLLLARQQFDGAFVGFGTAAGEVGVVHAAELRQALGQLDRAVVVQARAAAGAAPALTVHASSGRRVAQKVLTAQPCTRSR